MAALLVALSTHLGGGTGCALIYSSYPLPPCLHLLQWGEGNCGRGARRAHGEWRAGVGRGEAGSAGREGGCTKLGIDDIKNTEHTMQMDQLNPPVKKMARPFALPRPVAVSNSVEAFCFALPSPVASSKLLNDKMTLNMGNPAMALADELAQSLSITESTSTDSRVPMSGNLSTSSSIDTSSISTSSSSTSTSLNNSIAGIKISDSKSGECKPAEKNNNNNNNDDHNNSKNENEKLECGESGKSSYSSVLSDESSCSNNIGNAGFKKPHKANNDAGWEAIQAVKKRDGGLGLSHFSLLKRLGCGDIGSVYLAELKGTNCYFAMKVMDKSSLASRKKLLRAQTEREILSALDHPFLPTLYSHFETDKFSCLVMEYCSGGDLHTFRQRQPAKHFSEPAARFYASEILLAIEYLHMMGVVYRDLKPENVLIRENGHIMLSDFDLSLRCVVSPTLVKPALVDLGPSCSIPTYCVKPSCIEPACVIPACIQPSCFMPNFFIQKSKRTRKSKIEILKQVTSLPELVAEPTSARSMSFVGTHEYLAPEIIKGEGHGSAVDWWTFGIFLYELLHGKTPFKGDGNRATLFNVAGQSLKFPETPVISSGAKDLIKGLLVKEPQQRLASKRGATEIKQHPFFEGVNWALIRSTTPPIIPKPIDLDFCMNRIALSALPVEKRVVDLGDSSSGNNPGFDSF
eukprot:Gb_29226 [translate_table: standard]